MRLHFLGGAAEVGASCVVVEASGRRVLIDAGIRMNAPDPLPDLSHLQDLGGIDAVVVTHAHADHIGALPLAVGPFPAAPVVATPATAGLMAVMLRDAVHIGESRAEAEGDLPAYGEPQVTALLERMRPLPFGQPLPLFGGADDREWQLTLFPAGHVLGAAMALLETPEGTILISGDVSIIPQATVGPAVPPRRPVDVLVLESTYGNRLHSQRAAEETRLVAQVQEIIARGGHCLIPAFALGRARLLLILAAARRRGEITTTPVWVDGLVRAVCGVYRSYAESGSFALRRLVERQGNPFFGPDGPVRAVKQLEDRDAILAGPPAIVVSSSGMLQGGPSAFYAAKLAGDERHGILITGYQDEEAPGRRLLELAQAGPEAERRLVLNGIEVELRCSISRYNLSAHADGDELAALAERFRPGLTLLVHGDVEARSGLADRLNRRDLTCRLPLNGDTVELAPKRANFAEPPDRDLTRQLTSWPRWPEPPVPDGPWTALELAERYYGEITAAGVAAVGLLLASGDTFVPDRLRPMVYRLAPTQPLGDAAFAGPKSQEEARRLVDEAFADDPTFTKASFYLDERRIELRFHFPDVARVRHADTLARLAAEIGWLVGLRSTPDQMAIQSLARRVLPAGVQPAAAASLRLESKLVELQIEGEAPPEELAAAAATFQRETGFVLIFRGDGDAANGESANGEAVETALVDPTASGLAAEDVGKLELNTAFATIKESLAADGAAVYRVARHGEAIEVAFITPPVGARWRDQVARLQASLGWPIEIARQPQQGALIELVREIVGRKIVRGPGIHVDDERVRIRLAPDEQPSESEIADWKQRIYDQTGYQLVVD